MIKIWRCKKCGSYEINQKIRGTENCEYDRNGESILILWSNIKTKVFCEHCGNEAKKYSFNTNINEIAEWVEE